MERIDSRQVDATRLSGSSSTDVKSFASNCKLRRTSKIATGHSPVLDSDIESNWRESLAKRFSRFYKKGLDGADESVRMKLFINKTMTGNMFSSSFIVCFCFSLPTPPPAAHPCENGRKFQLLYSARHISKATCPCTKVQIRFLSLYILAREPVADDQRTQKMQQQFAMCRVSF